MVVGPYPPPVHGASRIAELVVAGARHQGIDVEVTSTAVSGRLYHLRRLAKNVLVVAKLLRRRHGVRVYQTGAGGLALYYQAAIAWTARRLGVPQTFHHHSFAYLHAPSRAMTALVAAGGPGLLHVALCDAMAERLRSMYGCDRVEVFSNALFLGTGRTTSRTPGDELVVGHLSNLTVEKGLDVVLDTVRSLRRAGMPVRLELAGPASDEQAAALVRDFLAEGGDRDRWRGFVDPAHVGAFMRDLDCFVFPSRYPNEAAPLVVLEALREGTPVVASSTGCLGEMLAAAGWATDTDSRRVAEAVREVLQCDDRRETAMTIYREQFTGQPLQNFYSLVASG